METRFDELRLLEALLFAATEPLSPESLSHHFQKTVELLPLLEELQTLYENRGINLVRVEDKWAFRTAPDMAPLLRVEQKQTKPLTRAGIETLAIIAYHQPVTRAEIEEIRGVALSKGTLDTLLEIGWVKPKGRRRTPGRPVTWATSENFLDHFALESLDDLPGFEELKIAGLLDARPAITALGDHGDLLGTSNEGVDIETARDEEGHQIDFNEDNLDEQNDQSSLPV